MRTASPLPVRSGIDEDIVATAAALLAKGISDEAERDRKALDDACRLVARLFFDHGYEVGYQRAMNEVTEQQRELNEDLVRGYFLIDRADHARQNPQLDVQCVEAGCEARLSVPYRTRLDVVRCMAHRPATWCDAHQEHDSCQFQQWVKTNLRPEFMGCAGGVA